MYFTSLGLSPTIKKKTQQQNCRLKGLKLKEFLCPTCSLKNKPYPSTVKVPKTYFKIT